MLDELLALFARAAADPQVRALLLRSNPAQYFCAGLDLQVVERATSAEVRVPSALIKTDPPVLIETDPASAHGLVRHAGIFRGLSGFLGGFWIGAQPVGCSVIALAQAGR
jgi:enoyl-CoA hydratase/carnithine racemase